MWADELAADGYWAAPADANPRLQRGEAWTTAAYKRPTGASPPAAWAPEPWHEPFDENVLYRRWKRRVVEGDPNDFVIAISASPKHTGVSGTGKTTLALRFAKRYFDVSDSGFDAEEQATLKSHELGKMYRENDRGSALIFDEAQGVTASSGVNSRRSMASSTIEAIGTVAANRMRSMTLLVVSQNIKWLDKNLLDLVDCWVRITKEPSDPNGPKATAYGLYSSDMDFESRETRTPTITDLTWGDVPDSDADYRTMERLKEEATSGVTEPEERELPTEIRDAKINTLVERGIPQKKVAEAFELSPQRISQIVNGGG